MVGNFFREYILQLVIWLTVTSTLTVFAFIGRYWSWPTAVVGRGYGGHLNPVSVPGEKYSVLADRAYSGRVRMLIKTVRLVFRFSSAPFEFRSHLRRDL